MRVRQVIEESSGRVCKDAGVGHGQGRGRGQRQGSGRGQGQGLGTMILHDGDIIWNEFGNDELAGIVSRYIRLQEFSLVRDSFRWCFSTTSSSSSSTTNGTEDFDFDAEREDGDGGGDEPDSDADSGEEDEEGEEEGFYDERGGGTGGGKEPQNDPMSLDTSATTHAPATATAGGKKTIIGNVRNVMK